jgi:plasmid stabilization system protein ParE
VRYTLHPEAERDLEEILERYLTRFGKDAAKRFLKEYERIRAIVVENPELGTKTSRGRRSYPFKKMPYLLVYREDGSGITILIVRHQHRQPGLGGQRK